MSNPLVSVIIPTYNTEKFIGEALNSVFSQSYRPIEVIVVDDGSTDNTEDIVKNYQTSKTSKTNETNLIYIYQENGGRASARNTGIRAARGKYVAFLDSDDLWTPGKVKKQVGIMEENKDIDFLFGDKQRFSDNGRIITSSMFKKQSYDKDFFGDSLFVRDSYRKLLRANFIPTGTVMMRSGCFDITGFFDEGIYAEDYEFWLRAALFINMAYANELWELERDREGSGSKNLKAVYLSKISSLEKHEREFNDIQKKLNIDFNSTICEHYRNTGYFFLTYDHLLARECFRKSLSRGFQVRTFIYWLFTFLGISLLKVVWRLRT
jgi:glycosyltransferase involved in cell wall biosynthesis